MKASSLLALAGAAGAAAQASTNWTILNTFQAIAIASDQVDGKVGYVGAGVNGVGYGLWKTTDNWQTYTTTAFSNALILTDVASFGTNVQVVGTLDFYYSNDSGATFKNSTMQYPGVANAVQTIGPTEKEIGFGMVGAFVVQFPFVQDNGIALSFNAGANYSATNISSLNTDTRYGSFISDSTFFVTAGQFPGEGSDDNGGTTTGGGSSPTSVASASEYVVDRSHYRNAEQIPEGSTFLKAHGGLAHILRSPKGDAVFAVVKKEHLINANVAPKRLGSGPNITTYWDEITKTTDGGKTWTTVYNLFNKNYGNHIHCTSETHCCMAFEAPAVTGAGILCTFDGETFTTTYQNPDPYSSIVGISAISEDIWWATGGELTSLGVQNSQQYQSVDGGKTWAKAGQQFSQLYGVDIDCVPSQNNCWVTFLNQAQQSFAIGSLTQ